MNSVYTSTTLTVLTLLLSLIALLFCVPHAFAAEEEQEVLGVPNIKVIAPLIGVDDTEHLGRLPAAPSLPLNEEDETSYYETATALTEEYTEETVEEEVPVSAEESAVIDPVSEITEEPIIGSEETEEDIPEEVLQILEALNSGSMPVGGSVPFEDSVDFAEVMLDEDVQGAPEVSETALEESEESVAEAVEVIVDSEETQEEEREPETDLPAVVEQEETVELEETDTALVEEEPAVPETEQEPETDLPAVVEQEEAVELEETTTALVEEEEPVSPEEEPAVIDPAPETPEEPVVEISVPVVEPETTPVAEEDTFFGQTEIPSATTRSFLFAPQIIVEEGEEVAETSRRRRSVVAPSFDEPMLVEETAYLHPETGEEVTEEILAAHLKEQVTALKSSINLLLQQRIVQLQNAALATGAALPSAGSTLRVYVHPETAEEISREELITYLEKRIATAKERVVALQQLPEEVDASASDETVVPEDFERLSRGSRGSRVLALQLFLNGHGFPLVESGYGAPGQETTYFGPLTEKAVRAFQQANDLPASGVLDVDTHRLVRAVDPSVFVGTDSLALPEIVEEAVTDTSSVEEEVVAEEPEIVVEETAETEEEEEEDDEEKESSGFFGVIWRFIVSLFT